MGVGVEETASYPVEKGAQLVRGRPGVWTCNVSKRDGEVVGSGAAEHARGEEEKESIELPQVVLQRGSRQKNLIGSCTVPEQVNVTECGGRNVGG